MPKIEINKIEKEDPIAEMFLKSCVWPYEDCLVRKNDDIIIFKVPPIEKFMGRSYDGLLDMRSIAQYPMKKYNGFPSLSLRDFKAWTKSLDIDGVDPRQISLALIKSKDQIKKLEEIEDQYLEGIRAIGEFCGYPDVEVIDWFKFRVDCPIQRIDRVYCVSVECQDIVDRNLCQDIEDKVL